MFSWNIALESLQVEHDWKDESQQGTSEGTLEVQELINVCYVVSTWTAEYGYYNSCDYVLEFRIVFTCRYVFVKAEFFEESENRYDLYGIAAYDS